MSFSFLSEDEDRALSLAMRKTMKKIEAAAAAAAQTLAQAAAAAAGGKGGSGPGLVGEEEEEDLHYTWWERNYDDDFTRRNHLTTTQEATIRSVMTCRPELATFDGGPSGFDPFRAILPGEPEACFGRLWLGAEAASKHRRLVRRRSYIEGEQPGEWKARSAQLAASDRDATAKGKHRALQTQPPAATLRLSSPEAVAMLTRRLASLARPKEAPHWAGNALCTFKPAFASSATRRRAALSRLPPLGPSHSDPDLPRNHPPLELTKPRRVLARPSTSSPAGGRANAKKKTKKAKKGKGKKGKKGNDDENAETGDDDSNAPGESSQLSESAEKDDDEDEEDEDDDGNDNDDEGDKEKGGGRQARQIK